MNEGSEPYIHIDPRIVMSKKIFVRISDFSEESLGDDFSTYLDRLNSSIDEKFEDAGFVSIENGSKKTRVAVVEENEYLMDDVIWIERKMAEIHDDLFDFEDIRDGK